MRTNRQHPVNDWPVDIKVWGCGVLRVGIEASRMAGSECLDLVGVAREQSLRMGFVISDLDYSGR